MTLINELDLSILNQYMPTQN